MADKEMHHQKKQDDQETVVLSIGHAHTQAELCSLKKDYMTLRKIANAVKGDPNMYGRSSEYHNLAAEFARQHDFYNAFQIVERGLAQYPNDIDLLANAIHYGAYCGQDAKCEQYKVQLKARPRGAWNWRAFTFLIDYLKEKAEMTSLQETMEILAEALEITKEYQRVLPLEEKGYIAEAEVRKLRQRYMRDENSGASADEAEQEYKAAKAVLKKALEMPSLAAVQCALCYADILFEEQNYAETVRVCQQALTYAETQPSARIAYFKYLSALSKDALIRKAALTPGSENALKDQKQVMEVLNEFRVVFKIIGEPTYEKNIRNRAALLAAEAGVPLPKDFDKGPDIASLLAQLGAE